MIRQKELSRYGKFLPTWGQERSADAYLWERETQRGGEGNRAARIPKLVRTTQALKCHSRTEQHVLAYPFLWIGPVVSNNPAVTYLRLQGRLRSD